MPTRTLALLIAASAVAAHAQELDLSGFRPVAKGTEVEVTEPTHIEPPEPEAPPVAARKLEVTPPPAPVIVEQACTKRSGCGIGLVCSDYRSIGDGEGLGVCRPPPLIAPANGTRADRFKYQGKVPEGFHLVREPRAVLIGVGIGTFSAAYLAVIVWGVSVTGARPERFQPQILIPLAGPILLAGTQMRGSYGGFLSGVSDMLVILGATADLIVQATGIAMAVLGRAFPIRSLERDVEKPSVTFVPSAAGAPVGASLVGRF